MAESGRKVTWEPKCDRVQEPPPGTFASEAIQWFPCMKKGRNDGPGEEAWIRAQRLKDFIRERFVSKWKTEEPLFMKSASLLQSQECFILSQTGGHRLLLAPAKWHHKSLHEVKALFMDGVTETEIVKTMGRKFGSLVGRRANLPNHPAGVQKIVIDDGKELELPEEPSFHFPFDMPDQPIPQESTEVQVTVGDIIGEINKFASKAQQQTNVGVVVDQTKQVPHPLQQNGVDADATNLVRKKSWYVRMMDSYAHQQK
ncbi:hypothetical protein R1flu_024586 [Riccia fluitans]|uniref:Uncharacterized protein n=1 Tax=Riccia fluitans TaxID=41844 RepID=A0ABD1XVC6_9MARC